MDRTALWNRIEGFSFDEPDAAFRFSDRLAQENGWSREFTLRVIDEYKRFLFLGVTAGHPVTPSDAVDQAWHLHMTFTRSYWDDLCGTVLRRAFHHGPTRGGTSEREKFHDWYARTLQSYESTFGTPPPADLWPSPAERFRPARFERVDRCTHWIIPKLTSRPVWAFPILVLLGGCVFAASTDDEISWFGVAIIGIGIVCVLMGILKHVSGPRHRGSRRKDRSSGGCGYSGGDSGCGSDGGSSGCGSGCGGGCGS